LNLPKDGITDDQNSPGRSQKSPTFFNYNGVENKAREDEPNNRPGNKQ
jgi:hypothetical protein